MSQNARKFFWNGHIRALEGDAESDLPSGPIEVWEDDLDTGGWEWVGEFPTFLDAVQSVSDYYGVYKFSSPDAGTYLGSMHSVRGGVEILVDY